MAKKMPEPLFIDTGYVIALVNENDQHHRHALMWADRYEGYPLVTTDAVLLELGNALSRIARQQASQIIRYFQNADEMTLIHLNPILFNNALHLYDLHLDKSWGLVDCVSFAVMREMQISIALAFQAFYSSRVSLGRDRVETNKHVTVKPQCCLTEQF